MLSANFASFKDFCHMGGYALYVWTAYGFCAAVLILQVISARLKFRLRRNRS